MKILNGLSKSEKDFVLHVIADCKKNDVRLYLGRGKTVVLDDDGSKCAGYFTPEPKPMLACATGGLIEDWLPVLVHEHSHMEQYLEQAPAWTNCMTPGGEDSCAIVFEWIAGHRELTKREIKHHFDRAREVEFDCEKRTAKKIKKFNLPYDETEYIQKSNAYVAFYNVMARTRKWYLTGRAPYKLADVWQNMPKTFNSKKLYNIPMEDSTLKLYQPCFDFDILGAEND